MTWDEFDKQFDLKNVYFPEKRVITDIDCPKCGNKIYERTDIILPSYPPQRQFECDCGWVGYH